MPSRNKKKKNSKESQTVETKEGVSFKKQRDEVRGRSNPDFY